MIIIGQHNVGGHNINKTDKCFENMIELELLGKKVLDKYYIHV